MDPNGRSRYDPLPPPPHFVAPNYYPHPHPTPPHLPLPPTPHHHHHHHHLLRERTHGPPEDHRLYLSRPDPPHFDRHSPPLPRVPDRIFSHEGYRHRLEPFPRDSWERRGADADRFSPRPRPFNERSYPIPSEREQEARPGFIYPRREPPSIMRRKRSRWNQDREMEVEDDPGRGVQRPMELWDDERRGGPQIYRHRDLAFEQGPLDFKFEQAPRDFKHDFKFEQTPRDFNFEEAPRDFKFEQAPLSNSFATPSPVVSQLDFMPNRGEETLPLFQRRLPSPPFRHANRSYSDMEAFEENMNLSLDDRDYKENHFVGNKGKRRVSGGYTEDFMGTPTKQKLLPKVLNRNQSGKSVWERIEERPAFLSSSSHPLSPPQSHPLPPPGSSGDQQLEIDDIDLSYKSNALVAKVLPSLGSIAPCSDGKGPTASNPTIKKKKVIKKKVIKKRTRVVVPIVTNSKGPISTEAPLKEPVSTNPHQVSGQAKTSLEAVVSSDNTASTSNPQSSLKKIARTASGVKGAAKKSAKKVVLAKDSVTENTQGEVKASRINEESRKYAEELLLEFIRSTEGASSQLCKQGSSALATTSEKSDKGQFGQIDKSVGDGEVKDIREEECVTSSGKAGPNCSNHIGSVMRVGDDACSQILPQAAAVVVVSCGNDASKVSFKDVALIEKRSEIISDPSKNSQFAEDAVNNAGYYTGLSLPSLNKESPISFSSEKAGDVMPGDSLNGKRGKRKMEKEEKQQQLATGKMTEGLDVLVGRLSELTDSCSNSPVDGTLVVLRPELKDANLDLIPLHGPKDGENHGLNLQVRDEPEFDKRIGQDRIAVPMTDSMGERVEQPLPFGHSKLDSLTAVSKVQELLHPISAGQSFAQLSDSKVINNDSYKINQNDLPFKRPSEIFFASKENEDVKSNKSTPLHLAFSGKVQSLSLHQSKKHTIVDQKVADEEFVRKTNSSSGLPRVVPSRVNSAGTTKATTSSTQNMRNKTWHRSNTPSSSPFSHGNLQGPGSSSMHKQSPKKLSRPSSSYVRKGNSLIRKLAPEVHPPKQSHDLGVSSRISRHTSNRSMAADINVGISDCVTGSNLPFERPKTPPLPLCTKLTIMNLTSDISHPMSEDLMPVVNVESRIEEHETQAADLLSGPTDDQNIVDCGNSEPSKTKKMTYVKLKSNQLVAAPRPESGDSCPQPTDNTHMPSSFTSPDLYFRKKKNQLVRNASTPDFQLKKNAASILDNSNSDDQRTSTVLSMKRSTTTRFRRRLHKVLQKTYKHPKFSHVWTLSGAESHKTGVTSSNCWKVLPHLFPWKRTIYSRNSNSSTAAMSNRRSLSLISRKLQHTRKRNTIYKVSTDGFSLRKAGVLSIGGASLQWSKSLEKHSKKANKEATLAVAEAERKKREIKRTISGGAKAKNGRCVPRERIFRVGSARYKMDSSRRTLIRIPDEQSSSVTNPQSGNKRRITFVPRRLLIGNDEYVRISNGNQLVRDPKRLTRILASEKVRWSLHTARLRLAKKQQYCQFFTRFGKCNKNGGKCPYIHDPAKIAICTKFLRGLCSNTSCKLTHKVIPERMPDCSYFLLGLCTKISCPYRHVNVNPNASVCEGFLKGYCAEGDECRKKHSYVCPVFEAMGKCPQGSKCKLHHPKIRNKSKRKKQPKVFQSKNWGRYFGISILEVGETLIVDSCEHGEEKTGDLCYSGGHLTDFISLDSSSDDDTEADAPVSSHRTQWASDFSELQPDELDALIKPLRIMKKANPTNP